MSKKFMFIVLITCQLNAQVTDSAVFEAVESLDPVKLENVKNSISNINMRNKNGDPLVIALVKAFREKAGSLRGKTALHFAVENNDYALAEKLVASGASPWQRDSDGMSPADIAAKRNYREISALFSRSGGRRGDNLVVMLSFLLESGADVNSRSADRQSLLYYTVLTGNTRAVSLVLSKNPKIDYRPSDKNETPLIAAIRLGYRDIALILIEKGADTDAVVKTGPDAVSSDTSEWKKPGDYNMKIVVFSPGVSGNRRCYYRVIINEEEIGRTEIGPESEKKIFTAYLNPNTYLLELEKYALDEKKNAYIKLNNIEQIRPSSYYFDTRTDRITVVTVRHEKSSESSYFSEFER